MRSNQVGILVAVLLAIVGARADDAATARTWGFDRDRAEEAPAGFDFVWTGGGRPGRWVVRADATAPSRPHVLAQLGADATDERFLVAVARAPSLRDLGLSVRCKPLAGRVDQACGLVFRYRDERNYDLVRANALENNVRFYEVRGGRRRQLADHRGSIAAGVWHELRVEATGTRVRVHWDGVAVIDARNASAPAPGRVGLWTKADSVTSFDDLSVAPR